MLFESHGKRYLRYQENLGFRTFVEFLMFKEDWLMETRCTIWDHSFSKFAKFSEKLTFLTPQYAYVHTGGKKC